ncbi:cation:proton antiporter [Periweissella fabalis]|uniref:Cation:proton antiporter n=1 Tax=Periweissella fabalis TaxID=1070421 RepID=A0A7X6N3R8_9LACO|nr:cation:proton antiporter [Periweissella fabalis]MCM0599070.1 cation:proton antiporter [Periweissella fabalis]NKZ23350.1 cation:proton antiporter [Periweissella fabalis]
MLVVICLVLVALLVGWLVEKIHLPAVIGQILAGLLFGPSLLNLDLPTDWLHWAGELGVWVLMYEAGIAVDAQLLKANFKIANRVAWLGALVPFTVFLIIELSLQQSLLIASFSGLVFAATSISITLAVLGSHHQLGSRLGSIILGAAIIDDIIAIIGLSGLTLLTSGGNVNPANLLPLVCFILGFISRRFAPFEAFNHGLVSIATWTVIPIFFAGIGLQINLLTLKSNLGPLVIWTIIAIITKMLGALVASKWSGLPTIEAAAIGSGMIARGEMALVILSAGLASHLITSNQFGFYTAVVTLTTVIAPFIMEPLFKRLH